MPNTRGIRAGRAFVELGVSDRLSGALRRAQRRLRAFGAGVRQLGLRLVTTAGALFAPIGIAAVKAASDAEEALSRFRQVFGKEASAAAAFADELAKAVGRSSLAVKDSLATFQSFFVGLGFGAPKARELSQTLASLALDFASFNNLTDEEALERFIAGLSGSSEVFDRFGINIKQAALEQELLRLGLAESAAAATEQQKAIARLNIIMRAMGDQGAIGDAVRTSGSFANQMKRLRGELRDAAVAIGRALLPVLTPVVMFLGAATRAVREWADRNPRLVATVFAVGAAVIGLGGALIALGIVITLASVGLGGLATAVGVVASAIGAVLSPIGLLVAALAGGVVAFFRFSSAGQAALDFLRERFRLLAGIVTRTLGGIRDALAAGDIGLAARVLWAGLKLTFLEGTKEIRETFAEGLLVMRLAMVDVLGTMSRLWTRFASGVQGVWERTQNFLAKRFTELFGLFDASLDVEAAKAQLDEQSRAKLESLARETEDALQRISDEQDARTKGILDDAADKMEERRKELEDARRKLDEAIEEARQRREAGDEASPDAAPSLQDRIGDFEDLLAGAGETVARRVEARGTFNALAAQGLASGSDAIDRTARASEQTARNTRRLVESARSGGLTFA